MGILGFLITYCIWVCWEDMSGSIGGNKHLSRKSEGMKVYVYAAELLLLHSLTEWGKWLHSYCSHLLSNVGKATTWTTQPGPRLAWQVVSEREDTVRETSASWPSPWWQGSPSASKWYECLSSFLLHLASLVKSWNSECPMSCFLGPDNPSAFV